MKLPNLAKLSTNQKLVVGGAAAAATVALGLKARSSSGGAQHVASVTSAPTRASGYTTATGSAGGSYDSTAYDVYNSLQPQIETLMNQVDRLGEQITTPTQSLNPATPPPPAPSHSNVNSSALVRLFDGKIVNASDLAFFGTKPNPDGTWSVPTGSIVQNPVPMSIPTPVDPSPVYGT